MLRPRTTTIFTSRRWSVAIHWCITCLFVGYSRAQRCIDRPTTVFMLCQYVLLGKNTSRCVSTRLCFDSALLSIVPVLNVLSCYSLQVFTDSVRLEECHCHVDSVRYHAERCCYCHHFPCGCTTSTTGSLLDTLHVRSKKSVDRRREKAAKTLYMNQ